MRVWTFSETKSSMADRNSYCYCYSYKRKTRVGKQWHADSYLWKILLINPAPSPCRLTGDVCSGVGGRAGIEKGKPFAVVGPHGICSLGHQHKAPSKCPTLIIGQRPIPGPTNCSGVRAGGRIHQKTVAATQTREKETPTRRKHVVCSSRTIVLL